jgi:hypothetical protein
MARWFARNELLIPNKNGTQGGKNDQMAHDHALGWLALSNANSIPEISIEDF